MDNVKDILSNLYNDGHSRNHLNILKSHVNFKDTEDKILDEINKDSIRLSELKIYFMDDAKNFKFIIIFYIAKYALLIKFLEKAEEYERCRLIYNHTLTLLNEIFEIELNELERVLSESIKEFKLTL